MTLLRHREDDNFSNILTGSYNTVLEEVFITETVNTPTATSSRTLVLTFEEMDTLVHWYTTVVLPTAHHEKDHVQRT